MYAFCVFVFFKIKQSREISIPWQMQLSLFVRSTVRCDLCAFVRERKETNKETEPERHKLKVMSLNSPSSTLCNV